MCWICIHYFSSVDRARTTEKFYDSSYLQYSERGFNQLLLLIVLLFTPFFSVTYFFLLKNVHTLHPRISIFWLVAKIKPQVDSQKVTNVQFHLSHSQLDGKLFLVLSDSRNGNIIRFFFNSSSQVWNNFTMVIHS